MLRGRALTAQARSPGFTIPLHTPHMELNLTCQLQAEVEHWLHKPGALCSTLDNCQLFTWLYFLHSLSGREEVVLFHRKYHSQLLFPYHDNLQVLSKAFDHTLGGRDFDKRLVDHFAAEFKERYKIDSLAKPKQRLRLTNECEKVKKNMSVNNTPIPLNIDCFSDDKDVSGRIKRWVL